MGADVINLLHSNTMLTTADCGHACICFMIRVAPYKAVMTAVCVYQQSCIVMLCYLLSIEYSSGKGLPAHRGHQTICYGPSTASISDSTRYHQDMVRPLHSTWQLQGAIAVP